MKKISKRLLSHLLYYVGHCVSVIMDCGIPCLYPIYNWFMVNSYSIQGDGEGPWEFYSKRGMGCPICEVGLLIPIEEEAGFRYKDIDILSPLHYHRCSHCGEELGTEDDTRINKNAMLQWKYTIDMEEMI